MHNAAFGRARASTASTSPLRVAPADLRDGAARPRGARASTAPTSRCRTRRAPRRCATSCRRGARRRHRQHAQLLPGGGLRGDSPTASASWRRSPTRRRARCAAARCWAPAARRARPPRRCCAAGRRPADGRGAAARGRGRARGGAGARSSPTRESRGRVASRPARRPARATARRSAGIADLKALPLPADASERWTPSADFAYRPDGSPTPLARAPRRAALPVVDGLELLVRQGALSFTALDGHRAAARRHARARRGRERPLPAWRAGRSSAAGVGALAWRSRSMPLASRAPRARAEQPAWTRTASRARCRWRSSRRVVCGAVGPALRRRARARAGPAAVRSCSWA